MAAGRKIFLRRFQFPVVVYLLWLSIVHPIWAQRLQPSPAPQYTIERIEFVGNRRIQRDTLLARIFSRPGDPYSEEGVHRDFQALWNTQFFEDIRLEVEDSPTNPNAKILVYYVTERPIIRRIEYKGNKSITESDILDRFKERKVGLSVESQFDPDKDQTRRGGSEGAACRARSPICHREADLRENRGDQCREACIQY